MKIHFGQAEHDFILFDVLERSYPAANDFYDGNWLNVKFSVEAGCFSGKVDGQIRADELASFQADLEKLNRSLSGTVKYSAIEKWLSLEFTGDGKGHIRCLGNVSDEYGRGNELNFQLNFDQTYLSEFLNDLKQVTGIFPVRGLI